MSSHTNDQNNASYVRRSANAPYGGSPNSPYQGPPQGGPSAPPPQPGYGPAYGVPQQGGPQQGGRRPVRRRGPLPRGCLGCLLLVLGFIGVVSCVTVTALVIIWTNLSNQLTDRLDQAQKQLEQQTFQTTTIYDRQGNELHQIFDQGRRTKVKLEEVPKSLIDATIAVEDKTFYDNPGVDWTATIRAGLQFVGLYEGASGGGTITQQLVRNIAFDYAQRLERSPQRKFDEIMMALILNRQKSKDDILEMYLNQIYYGNLAYGVQAAAQTYFGKNAKDLTLAEASLLAGLPQAPAELDPLNPDPKVQDEVLARRKVVLDLMVDTGKITRQQANDASAQPLSYANPNVNLRSPHFTLYAEQEMRSLLDSLKLPPSLVTTGGLKVYTTLDPRYETLAENVARQQIASIKDTHNAHNAAVVILKPTTGEILAMMGSVDYNDVGIKGQVNVTVSPRQPGSAMKILTYGAAMEKGWTAASVLWDVPTHIKAPGLDYAPVNYDGRFHGPVRLRDAFANSYNIPAVQTLRSVGVDYLLSFAQRMQITSLGTDPSKYGLSLTLGGGDLTPLELTRAYSVYANGGQLVSSTAILCIINSDGKVLYQYEGGCTGKGVQDAATINAAASAKAVLDPRIAFVISDILADNAARSPAMGANSPLRTDGMVTSVKTGTTNDYRDNWTVGYTHNVVVGVWVGNTDNTPMNNSTGLTGAAPIWHDVIAGIYSDPSMMETLKRAGALIPDTLNPPPGVYKKQLCSLASLKDPATTCQPGRSEWFLDSPAAVPDANGKLVVQPGARPLAPTAIPASANGPIIMDVDPGVAQTLVQPLDPALAASLVANTQSGQQAAPPRYCLVPNEVKDQIPSASLQYFIRPPHFPDDVIAAENYAQGSGDAILPNVPCTPEMLQAGAPSAPGATARIMSPAPGQTVTGTVEVSGVANWQPGQAAYFKMEIQGPQFPQWITFGETHSTPVINGPLDHFGASGLAPGAYKLRIIIVGVDGNYLLVGGEVPITITGQ